MACSPVDSASAKRSVPHIAVIDEDPDVLNYVRESLDSQFNLHLFSRADQVTQELAGALVPDLVLLDCHVSGDTPDQSVYSLLADIRKRRPGVPVVMLSCSDNSQQLIRASQMGAAGFLLKPLQKNDICVLVEQHLAHSNARHGDVNEVPLDEDTSFVRASKCMLQVESHCRLVGPTDIPVLILGESGSGKEIAAKFIHKMSSRSERSFLKINCAAMPLDLLESELFGYERGAFTGAVKSKPGKFELCNKGTIFLDEIGEMPTALQSKLLQVLQDGTFSRLGGQMIIKVDVRVIAATNIDIKAALASKAFREDLFYRLNGFLIRIPPLRNRSEEIPILTRYFLRRNAAKFQRDPLPVSPALMRALTSYSWPGNLRELDNVMKRYLVLSDEQEIINELHPGLGTRFLSDTPEETGTPTGLKGLVRGLKDDAESVLIAKTLEETGWNRTTAARKLGISYKALSYKIKRYHLEPAEAT